MFKIKLINVLKNRKSKNCEVETFRASGKRVKQKRLSSKEFLEGYDALWKEGPTVNYRHVGSKEMLSRSTNQNPIW